MKTIGKLVLTIVLLSTFSYVSLTAQRGPIHKSGPGMYPEHKFDSCKIQLRMDKMKTQLELDEKQHADLLQLHYDHMAEMKKLFLQKSDDCIAARDARIALRTDLHEAVMKILDKEQYGDYRAMMAHRHKRGGPGGKADCRR